MKPTAQVIGALLAHKEGTKPRCAESAHDAAISNAVAKLQEMQRALDEIDDLAKSGNASSHSDFGDIARNVT